MDFPDRYLVTSALPYANGPLHIGHLAGAYLSGDAFVRMLRLQGKDVLYVCGSDEHGAAITIRAKKEGISPSEIVDRYHDILKSTFNDIGMSFDIYHRTSAKIHHETSQDFFRTLNDQGKFERIESEQYYDQEAQQFLADRYIKGECPKCQYSDAYGDQCENCGSTLSPTELINPLSTITGTKPVLKRTTHWYLTLQHDGDWLKDWINKGTIDEKVHHDPKKWKNHVLGQCRSWIESGLTSRSMTRDLDWGIDVPTEIEGSEGKKLYVWLDAPIGYISATKAWANANGKDWESYWKDKNTGLVHFIGKDNIVFHCIIFPSILKAHGDYILPINVPANQFVNLEGKKLSTSRGWAVWVHEFLEDFPDKQDSLRYYLFKIMPELKDSEFTWKGLQEANNNELVNNLGNFVNRVSVLTNKYYDGIVPEFDETQSFESGEESDMPTWHDNELLRLFDEAQEVISYIYVYDFRSALRKVMELSSYGNQLLQANEPWKAQKEQPEVVKAVMHICLQYVYAIRLLARPFLPFFSDHLNTNLNLEAITDDGELLRMFDQLAEGIAPLNSGHKIGSATHMFTRIGDETIQQQIDKLHAAAKASDPHAVSKPIKDKIDFSTFEKMDLRIATVLAAEKVKKTKKLLKLTLDLGFEQRTVVSGIAEHYDPDNLNGQKVVLLANLEPRKIKGIESQGMILMAEDSQGKLAFVSPPESWEHGFEVR